MTDPFWFWRLDLSGKLMFILFVITGFFGMKLHFKLDIDKKTRLLKQELLQNCSTNNHCKKAVKTHFQKCFDDNFDENGLGHYTRFDQDEFSECMNKNAGFKYFVPIELEDL